MSWQSLKLHCWRYSAVKGEWFNSSSYHHDANPQPPPHPSAVPASPPSSIWPCSTPAAADTSPLVWAAALGVLDRTSATWEILYVFIGEVQRRSIVRYEVRLLLLDLKRDLVGCFYEVYTFADHIAYKIMIGDKNQRFMAVFSNSSIFCTLISANLNMYALSLVARIR